MGELMAALVKYSNSDSTKDAESDEEKAGKGKKNGNGKGQQHNMAGQGNNGKRKQADGGSYFVDNTNMQSNNQRRKGKSSTPRCRCQNRQISGRGSRTVRLRIDGNMRQGTRCLPRFGTS